MLTLSIIMPVYNGEKYIIESLNSILEQWNCSFDVEVIIINDGSTDKTQEIIEKCYNDQLESGLFKVINQSNSGVSTARNNGIKKSTGDYITFVDADDYILPGYFSDIFFNLKRYSVDILEFGCVSFKTDADINENPIIYTHDKFGLLDTSKVIADIFSKSIFYPPLRVIRRRFFEVNLFPVNVKFCEDLILLQKIYSESESIYHINKKLYAYRYNVNGATRNVKYEYIPTMINFYISIINRKEPEINHLKLNVLFVIYKLHETLGLNFTLPKKLKRDSNKVFLKLIFDKKISYKKKIIIFCPSLFMRLRNILKNKLGLL
ncbi:glycosyltransferase family 2 protein [Pseudoalteromonas sp. APC 3358]|uniref:glycosyltransferase family 2 protein n=1 Tax=Pseudoalteromonas sp. APC 3358 TaxID=3035176 RepID=UPI0025B55B82|nr:glycosyltransferase family 2 protein [Pseudoalteromonas sp. APC 3358]MDN3384685.1 glycosyltransferase family 2 protein [Pseudoalteromonas sp. APC 3358]